LADILAHTEVLTHCKSADNLQTAPQKRRRVIENSAIKSLIPVEEFKALLPLICDCETSRDTEHWTPENPLCGHCAVGALVAQNLFGGELLRASLAEIPEFAHMRSHYWNRLPDGTEVDFSAPQFGGRYPVGLKSEARTRSYVLSFPETAKRYKLLMTRLGKKLGLIGSAE